MIMKILNMFFAVLFTMFVAINFIIGDDTMLIFNAVLVTFYVTQIRLDMLESSLKEGDG